MTIPQDKAARSIDPRIRKELLSAAKRFRESKLFRAGSRRWLIASGLTLLILGIRTFWPSLSGLTFPLVCIVLVGTLFTNMLAKFKTPLDFAEAAKEVEAKYPDLGNMLTTALEQKRPGEGYNFLQEKVISEALNFSFFQYWENTGKKRQTKLKLLHAGSVLVMLGLVTLSWYAKGQERWIDAPNLPVLVSSVGYRRANYRPSRPTLEPGRNWNKKQRQKSQPQTGIWVQVLV